MADGLELNEMMKRAVQANAKFYKGWMDLTLEYVRGMAAILSGDPHEPSPTTEMDAGGGALVLEGEAGRAVSGSFLVSNDLDRALSCDFVASDFVDPSGTRVDLNPTFEPTRLDLRPGEQRVVQATVMVHDKLAPGVGYAGEFSIKGLDGFAVAVVVRRQHLVDESAADNLPTASTKANADDIGTATIGATNPATPKSRAKTAKRGVAKKKSRSR